MTQNAPGNDPRRGLDSENRKSSGRDSYTVSFQPLQQTRIEFVQERRVQRDAERVHALGARPMFEAMRELESGRTVADTLADYARLPVEVVRDLGADHFPPLPICAVSS